MEADDREHPRPPHHLPGRKPCQEAAATPEHGPPEHCDIIVEMPMDVNGHLGLGVGDGAVRRCRRQKEEVEGAEGAMLLFTSARVP